MRGFPKVTPHSYEDWLWVMDGWHHLVVVFGDGLPIVYFDGEHPKMASDFAVYDRALTPDEIAAHYAVRSVTEA
jgi:hypothetical protein